MDRRSDKWSRLRNRWNNTMRASHADQFGYELPKNPDDISFVVAVRVVTAKAPSATAHQAVEVGHGGRAARCEGPGDGGFRVAQTRRRGTPRGNG